ncbi:MAG: FixH family protein [Phycisphaerales bacterium]
MSLRFDQPELLWILVLIVPIAWSGLAWLRGMSGLRRWTSVIVRTALIVLIVAMLAGATAHRTTNRLAVVAVLDVSESVRAFVPPIRSAGASGDGAPAESVIASVRSWVERASAGGAGRGQRGPDDLLGIVAFDGEGTVVLAPAPPLGAAAGGPTDGLRDVIAERALPTRMREGTDIAGALRLALASFPPDSQRRIVLVSDGNQTRGDALAAALEIGGAPGTAGARSAGAPRGAGVPIDVLPLHYEVNDAVVIESLDAPAKVPSGTMAALRVALRAAGPTRGTLRVLVDGQEARIGDEAGGGRAVVMDAGRRVEVVSVPVGAGRVHRFEALFEPAETVAPVRVVNNRAQAVAVSPATGAVLLVDGVDGGAPGRPGETLAAALRESGLAVEVVAPEGVPADMLQLQSYDLVILQNVAAHALGQDGMERLARFTTELGGGLVLIGGPDTLASGGFRGSPLEPILPVKLELPEKLVVPAAAVMIVMDCSGSMGWRIGGTGRTQQEVANEGAALASRTLDSGDLLGVIAFSSSYREVVPLARNKDAEKTAKAILAIEPGGGTNLPPALAEAGRQLAKVEAKVKHVIVLSDGLSQGRSTLQGIAKDLAAKGIKVSTIAVGDQADAAGMEEVSDAGGGTFYPVTDPRLLPRVFLRAVQVVRTPLIREEPFAPVLVDASDPLVQALEREGAMPNLLGLSLTAPRDDKTVLNPIVTPQGEPVLAHWQAGLGRVAVFTSDAHKWAAPWLDWPGYRALWTAIARGISRQASQRLADATAEVVGDRLTLRVEAVDQAGKPLDGLALSGGVYGPDGRRADVRLDQSGPGVYEASVPAPEPGTYVATISGKSAVPTAPAIAPMITAATRSAGDEFRSFRSDDQLLTQIAAATGGRVLNADGAPGVLFDRTGMAERRSRLPLWPWLLPWVVAALLLDVAVRRVAWDRLLDPTEDAALDSALRRGGARASAALSTLRRAGDRTEASLDSATTALSDKDAEQLAQEQSLRRRKGRADVKAPGTPLTPATTPAGRPEDAAVSEAPPAQPEEGGLLAAKRRARQRFDEEQPGGGGGA